MSRIDEIRARIESRVGVHVPAVEVLYILAELDRVTKERDAYRRATGYDDPDVLDSVLGRSGVDTHLGVLNRMRIDAERARDEWLAWIPTEFVAGEWILSGQSEPDAVVTYASEPSPETGHVGWCWWARGKMGEASSYIGARKAAEASLREHARGGR